MGNVRRELYCLCELAMFFYRFIVNTLTYFANFSLFMYGTSWLGSEVLGGDPDSASSASKDLFNRGVRLGNLGLALQYCLAMAVTLQFNIRGVRFHGVVPLLVDKWGVQTVYFASQVKNNDIITTIFICRHPQTFIHNHQRPIHIRLFQMNQGICLGLSLVAVATQSSTLAILMFAFFGFTWAVTMSVPWAGKNNLISITDEHPHTYIHTRPKIDFMQLSADVWS